MVSSSTFWLVWILTLSPTLYPEVSAVFLSRTTSSAVSGGRPSKSCQPFSSGLVSQLRPNVGGPPWGLPMRSPFLSRMAIWPWTWPSAAVTPGTPATIGTTSWEIESRKAPKPVSTWFVDRTTTSMFL